MEERRKEESKGDEEELAVCPIAPHSQPYPWLMLYEGKHKKKQIFYSITEDQYYVRFIRELYENDFIVCSNNKKWLIYQDHSTKECFLLNISTMEKLWLPSVKHLTDYEWLFLSSSIMDGTCRVVLFDLYPDRFLSCNLGDTKFMDQLVTFEGGWDDPFIAGINFHGNLCVLTPKYNLIAADYSDPNLFFKPMIIGKAIDTLVPAHEEMRSYLVESCGHILFVYTRSRDCELTELKIFRADFTRGEWAAVERLGDRAIFVDAHHSFSSPASRFGLRGNCVYFVNEFGKNLFVYDLEDESISMSLPCSIAKPNSFLFWMSISDE